MKCYRCGSENVKIEDARNQYRGSQEEYKVKFCYDCGHHVRQRKEVKV